MGWFLSSIFFHDIVSYVLGTCFDKFPPDVKVVHQIDDILINGTCLEDVKLTMDLVIKKFVNFGFVVRKDKCKGPSDSCTFCGLKLSADGSVRSVKRQLTEAAAQTAADVFQKTKSIEESRHILRSWLGTANYFSKWIPPDFRSKSPSLHSVLSNLDAGEITKKEIVEQPPIL